MNLKQQLEALIHKAYVSRENFVIIFLANVKDKTVNTYDYVDSSISTEFLTMEEYHELLTSLQNFGFCVYTYFDTTDFLKDYLNNKFYGMQLVLFEGTQKGIGRARDAFIPSFCDLEGIIHTGPNAYVNSICTNKYHWTKLLEQHGICVPHSWQFCGQEWLNKKSPDSSSLLIAKPCYECASIGIHKNSVAFYSNKYENLLKRLTDIYKQPFIVQEFINGYEVEVPIIIHQNNPYVLPPIVLYKGNNPKMGDEILDFDDIYDDAYCFCQLSNINEKFAKEVQQQALKIITILDLQNYARIDFRINSSGQSFVTDINSYPHIVKHSSFSYAFEQLQIASHDVLPCLIGNVLS